MIRRHANPRPSPRGLSIPVSRANYRVILIFHALPVGPCSNSLVMQPVSPPAGAVHSQTWSTRCRSRANSVHKPVGHPCRRTSQRRDQIIRPSTHTTERNLEKTPEIAPYSNISSQLDNE